MDEEPEEEDEDEGYKPLPHTMDSHSSGSFVYTPSVDRNLATRKHAHKIHRSQGEAMIPPVIAARMINESEHLERAFLYARDQRDHERRAGAIRTLMTIFRCRAIEAERDEIYLFDHYRFV